MFFCCRLFISSESGGVYFKFLCTALSSPIYHLGLAAFFLLYAGSRIFWLLHDITVDAAEYMIVCICSSVFVSSRYSVMISSFTNFIRLLVSCLNCRVGILFLFAGSQCCHIAKFILISSVSLSLTLCVMVSLGNWDVYEVFLLNFVGLFKFLAVLGLHIDFLSFT